MKILITDPAKASLRAIYRYYRLKGLGKAGRSIRVAIVKKALLLQNHPLLGQEEEELAHLAQGHRYLVEGNYKIVYRIIGQTVFVTDVFDTRQDPKKMKP